VEGLAKSSPTPPHKSKVKSSQGPSQGPESKSSPSQVKEGQGQGQSQAKAKAKEAQQKQAKLNKQTNKQTSQCIKSSAPEELLLTQVYST
jgi:hypothetical protein